MHYENKNTKFMLFLLYTFVFMFTANPFTLENLFLVTDL